MSPRPRSAISTISGPLRERRARNKFVDSITRRLSILTRSPKAGRVRDEIDFDLRGLPVGDYVVYYRESARSINISRIIHGSREQDVAYDDKLPR